MAVAALLWCIAALLATGVWGVAAARYKAATSAVYAVALLVSAVALFAGASFLLHGGARSEALTLPLGLPWLGAHFRIDALAALFLVVVNLGGLTASLYGLGYGRHEEAPARVLPFFPAFLAGMNLVGRDSGLSVNGRRWQSKRGRPMLRRQLFLLAGRWCTPRGLLRDDYLALCKRNGNCRTKAVCAVARKIVPILFEIMRSGRPFDVEKYRRNRHCSGRAA